MNNKFLPSYICDFLKEKYPNNEFNVEFFQTCNQIEPQNNVIYYAQVFGLHYQVEILQHLIEEQSAALVIDQKVETLSSFYFIRVFNPVSGCIFTGFKITFKNQIWQ